MEPTQRCIGYVIVCHTGWEHQSEQFTVEGYTGYDGNYEMDYTSGACCDPAPRIYHVTEVKDAIARTERYWSIIRCSFQEPYPIEARPVYI